MTLSLRNPQICHDRQAANRHGKLLVLAIALAAILAPETMAAPLKIAYSDCPA
jgi:hypothetical protein